MRSRPSLTRLEAPQPPAPRHPLRRRAPARLALPVLLAPLLLGACAFSPPAPWERGSLARPEMALQADPLEARLQQHLYSSKENASGGASIGGGGCGCN